MGTPRGWKRARRWLCEGAPRVALRLLALDGQELGLAGEALAARALVREGWRVLGRRVHTPRGEIDLWVERGAVRAVVEVKAGIVPVGCDPERLRFPPACRVDERRLARLRRAAGWLGVPGRRVDLFEVRVSAEGREIRLRRWSDLEHAPWRGDPGPPRS